jgi:hypothetical protein
MYCPRCSQQQVSDDVRFCSRCGFQLGIVKALLAESSDALAVTEEPKAQAKVFSRRKQDLLLGATFMYGAAAVVVQLSWVQPKGLIIFPLGLLWVAFSLFVLFFDPLMSVARKLFSEDEQFSKTKLPDAFMTRVHSPRSSLPPTQSVAATALGSQRANTAEIVPPLSITEHTTDLLNRK